MIEVLDKSHKAGDHFNREVSAAKLCAGLSGPSLFLNSVWVYCSHLIVFNIPVEHIEPMRHVSFSSLDTIFSIEETSPH